jgi:hypothetical protein
MATQAEIASFDRAVSSGDYAKAGEIASKAGVTPKEVTSYLNQQGSRLGLAGPVSEKDVSSYMKGVSSKKEKLPKDEKPRVASAPLGSREEYLAELLGLIRGTYGGPMPQFFPGQTYVPPSAETLAALEQQKTLASSLAPMIEDARQAYMSTLGNIQQTATGQFLQGSPYRDAMVAAATRPLTQQFGEQVLPGISSQFSAAGRYGSGAMERAQERATEGYGRALGDVTASIVAQDYGRERQLQEAAMRDVGTLAGRAPQFFAASFLPSTALAQVGAQREAIAAQPLGEEMARFQFEQDLPFNQLARYASMIQGVPTPTPQPQGNTRLQDIGAGLNILNAIPGAISTARSVGSTIAGLLN